MPAWDERRGRVMRCSIVDVFGGTSIDLRYGTLGGEQKRETGRTGMWRKISEVWEYRGRFNERLDAMNGLVTETWAHERVSQWVGTPGFVAQQYLDRVTSGTAAMTPVGMAAVSFLNDGRLIRITCHCRKSDLSMPIPAAQWVVQHKQTYLCTLVNPEDL
jgi:hypothetical protein